MERARQIIRESLAGSNHPALLLSGGKDSLLLLTLIREVKPDIQCVWFNSGLTRRQKQFTEKMIMDLSLDVYSWPPAQVYVMPSRESGVGLHLVREQSFGDNTLPFVTDIAEGEGCVFDFPAERKEKLYPPFDTLLMGYKDADYCWALGGTGFCPPDGWLLGQAKVYAPLRHLTDEQVWAAITELDIKTDTERYKNGNPQADPDQHFACSSCLQAGETATVFCPKADERIPRRNWPAEQHLVQFQKRFGLRRAA